MVVQIDAECNRGSFDFAQDDTAWFELRMIWAEMWAG
jgi:hypothetical protein